MTIENAEGEQETIDSTPEHPFYVEGLGWVEASSLHAGMTIWFANGTKGTVEDISNEGLEEPVTVYNFEVTDFHTYFVGECGVLVHNTCTIQDNYKKGHEYQDEVTQKIQNDLGAENVATEITLKQIDPDTHEIMGVPGTTIRADVIDKSTGTIYEIKASTSAQFTDNQTNAGYDNAKLGATYVAVGARAERAGILGQEFVVGTPVQRVDPGNPYIPKNGD